MSIIDVPVKTLQGEDASLLDHKDEAILIVNVASKCGLTPQYEGLEKLYEQYKDRGLVVAGFPANDFGAQEPGTNEEIADFCSTKFGVSFPMYEKIVHELGTTYSLGFAPANAHPDGKRHKIDVRLRSGTFQLRQSRYRYTAN